ncbi:MAG: hypothetical protein AAGF92_02115 [Myxococcota bacterium]
MDESDEIVDWGVDAIGTSRTWLEGRLRDEGVAVHPESAMARGLSAVNELRESLGRGARLKRSPQAIYDLWSPGVGIDFLSKAIHRAFLGGLRPPRRLWKALAAGEPNVFRAAPSSTDRNLVWELLLGSLCTEFCETVEFGEPDVTCGFGGGRANVAAKVAYSPKKLWPNALKGFGRSRPSSTSWW